MSNNDSGNGPVDEPSGVALLRRANKAVGVVEQAVLAALLLTLITAAILQAIYGNLLNRELGWSDEVIRYSVYYIAMISAAFAAGRQRMISMDILTRVMTARQKGLVWGTLKNDPALAVDKTEMENG